MCRLVVVFFLSVAFQVVFSELTPGFGYGPEKELKDFIHEIVQFSKNVEQAFEDTSMILLPGWEHDQNLDEIIGTLEDVITKYDKQVGSAIKNFFQLLSNVLTYFKQLQSSSDETNIHNLVQSIATETEKMVQNMELWIEVFAEESVHDNLYMEIRPLLERTMYALRPFDDAINSREDRSLTHRRASIKSIPYSETHDVLYDITQELEVLLETISFSNAISKHNFVYVVREYFYNLRRYSSSELDAYHKLIDSKQMPSMNEVKQHLSSFVKTFSDRLEQMHETSKTAFVKATRILLIRLKDIVYINTPVRQLLFQILVEADTLSTLYEIVPLETDGMKDIIKKHALNFVEQLKHIILKISERRGHPEIISNWKKMISNLANALDKHTLIITLQQASAETHKLLIAYSENTEFTFDIATKFLDGLNSQLKLASDLCQNLYDVEFWSLHLVAVTNRVSMYIHDEIYPEDMNTVMRAVDDIFNILENETSIEFKQTSDRLKIIIKEFETRDYHINTFLQKIALELDQLVRDVHESTGSFPKNILQVLRLYIVAVEQICTQSKINKGLLALETPAKTFMKIENVAEQFSRMLDILVPGFESTRQYYRGHYFYELLERVVFRLQKVSHGHELQGLLNVIAEKIGQIQANLINDLNEHDSYFKVKFGMYVQEAVRELKKVAFEKRSVGDIEILKMFGDFLYGIEHMMGQIQYDLQVILEKHSPQILNLQIGPVSHSLLTTFQRTQLKPELKQVAITQVDCLSRQVKLVLKHFAKIQNGKDLFGKYIKIYEKLLHVVKTGDTMSIEEIFKLLELVAKELVLDLEALTRYTPESQALRQIFRYTLIVFSRIMVRLENLHEYEYYNFLVGTYDPAELVEKFSSAVVNKLQNTFVDTIDIKHDAAIQTLLYAHAVEKTAVRLQVDGALSPKGLFKVAFDLAKLAHPNAIDVKTFGVSFKKHIQTVAYEIQDALTNESHVGTDDAIVKYLIAIEEMYIHTQHVFERSQHSHPVHYLTMHTETHTHYLTKALENIDPENQAAVAVLFTEYNRLLDLVSLLSKKTGQFNKYPAVFQTILKKISECKYSTNKNWNDVDEFKIDIAVYVQHVGYVFKETSWLLPEYHEYEKNYQNNEFVLENSDTDKIFKSWFYEFLVTIQRITIKIETGIILQSKWGLTKTAYNKKHDYSGYRSKRQLEDKNKREAQVERIKDSARSLVDDINKIDTNSYDAKNDLILYLQELIEMLINVINLLKEQQASQYKFKNVTESLTDIKVNLQKVYSNRTLYKASGITTALSNSMEQTSKKVAELPLLIEEQGSQTLERIFDQFFSYVRDVKDHIDNVVQGRGPESNSTQPDYSEA